jgi:hypothetical protein
MANLVATVDMKYKVCGVNDKTDLQNRPKRESSQYFTNMKFQTQEIDEDEWMWRCIIAWIVLCWGTDWL